MALPWFRFYAEFVSDAKVCTLDERDQIRLVKLFCLRCSDTLETLDDEEIAFALHITPEELAQTKSNLIRKGFLTEDWAIRNWSKRQYKSDSSTDRVRKFRAKETPGKTEANVTETGKKRYSNGVDTETEVEAEKKTNKPGKVPRLGKVLIKEIVNIYHNKLKMLPNVRLPLGKVSSTNLRNRVKDLNTTEDKIKEHFTELFTTVSKSEFLTGKKTDWSATFHWIIRPTNYEKILNGEYTSLKTYKKDKPIKLYCTELGDDFKPLHPSVEVTRKSNGSNYVSCETCKGPMVEGYILESHISQAHKDLSNKRVHTGFTSISEILTRRKE